MEKNNNELDRYDVAASISSGALTATLDVLWVGDLSFNDAHNWGVEKTDKFVMNMAKRDGYKGKEISGAIKKLEDLHPWIGDEVTDQFGGGYNHHLRDFSHHPTPVGLVFALMMEFTGCGYGTDVTGKFVKYAVPNWKKKTFEESVYEGTVGWLFHLISDIAGSSGTRSNEKKYGTGLPGPMGALLKELSAIPGIRNIMGMTDPKNSGNKEANYVFSEKCSKLFNGTLLGEHDADGKIVKGGQLQFDLRTELGIAHETLANKQYIPVILNELIVAAFYSVRRFIMQMKEKQIDSVERLEEIDISKCLPWKNETIKHMRMISTTTFSVIDLTASGIKAAAKNGDNAAGFAKDFLQGINYWGLGSFALASSSELGVAIGKMKDKFVKLAQEQKQKLNELLPDSDKIGNSAKKVANTAMLIATNATPIGIGMEAVSIYEEIRKSLEELELAKEERIRIEQECAQRIMIIQQNREEMETVVSDYLYSRMTVFVQAFETMDRAITDNDVDAYIAGNNMIQTNLSGKSLFSDMNEFDDMMLSDDAIRL